MKLKLVIIGLVVSIGLGAVEVTNRSYNRFALNLGNMAITDHFLSNQEYKGLTFGFEAYHTAYYKGSDSCVSWAVYDQLRYGQLINASYSAMIQYVGGNAGFASHYNWHPIEGLKLMAGASFDVYGAIKSQSRNVNNPGSGDIQVNLMASIGAQYKFSWKKWALSLDYMAMSPMLGGMFVPEMGQSYYEIYLNMPQCFNDVVHFTSFHNRQGVKGNLSVNFVLPTATLFVGVTHNHQWWHANYMNFYVKEWSGQIGIALNLGIIKE